MSLFVVTHKHSPEQCLANDTIKAHILLNRISKDVTGKFGVTIHGEAVIQDQHTLIMILECSNEQKVRDLVTPFASEGSLEIQPANTCSTVVSRGRC